MNFAGDFNTLVIRNRDTAGRLADVTGALSRAGVNIANMSLCRSRRGGNALTVIETDEKAVSYTHLCQEG